MSWVIYGFYFVPDCPINIWHHMLCYLPNIYHYITFTRRLWREYIIWVRAVFPSRLSAVLQWFWCKRSLNNTEWMRCINRGEHWKDCRVIEESPNDKMSVWVIVPTALCWAETCMGYEKCRVEKCEWSWDEVFEKHDRSDTNGETWEQRGSLKSWNKTGIGWESWSASVEKERMDEYRMARKVLCRE